MLIVAPMGSGKTAGTLDAVRHLLDCGEVGHVLVIAPRFVAQSTWPDEIETWAHTKPISYAVAVGDPVQRRQAIERRAEITTINFENLTWLAKFIESVDNWFWDMVVIDESSRFKAGEGYTKDTRVKTVSENGDIVVKVRKGGKQTRFGIMATARRKIDRIVELTGTPTPQGLTDLWGQVFLLDRGRRLGAAKSTFLKRHFHIDRDRHLITPRANAERDILGAIKDVVITIKGESPVPEPQFFPLRVELPPKIMKDYKAFEDTLYSEPYDVRAVSAGVLANKLLQYSSGFLYREDKSFVEVHDAKIAALEELVAQAPGENLLIFYGFKPDLAKLKSKYPDAVVANEYKGNLVRDWNAGKIEKLLAHPACLHPSTEVLTELRGWQPIINVMPTDRVFDGVEFVTHDGCYFSGRKPVIDVFGIKMTPNHKILIGGKWVEGQHARDSEDLRGAARYTYGQTPSGPCEMLPLRQRVRHASAECYQAQPGRPGVLQTLLAGKESRHEFNDAISEMVQHEASGNRPTGRELRRARPRDLGKLDGIREFLSRYGAELCPRSDNRTDRREQGLLQRELHMGNTLGAAGQQTHQSGDALSWQAGASCGIVPNHRTQQESTSITPGEGNERRGSCCARERVNLRDGSPRNESQGQWEAPEVSEVYDLVNCGPRHRFLIRNAEGEMFISHNSIGHGTNLQYGGHIAVWYTLTWSLELWQQANMRLPRPGQTKQVLIYPIIARGTYDERALSVLSKKEVTQDRIIRSFLDRT